MIEYDNNYFPPAPIARITVFNMESGDAVADVPMLLDTGADCSLIPEAVIRGLGIKVSTHDELAGFDGVARATPEVHARILLYGHRFSGCFYVVDQSPGIIGRNVLNHFRLILDGPGKVWRIELGT